MLTGQTYFVLSAVEPQGFYCSIYSYHQKYILRQHAHIVEKLGLTDAELIKSKAACRLNGYLGGYGTSEDFAKVSCQA